MAGASSRAALQRVRGQEERVLEDGRSRPDTQEPAAEGAESEGVCKARPAAMQMTHLSR